ncbi:MAG: hypothetical protein C4532_20005 [Candidatus Abyssobacteria bacterium SURF_17]|uniref:Uncharacterized protein n=1 Tax=Candidatus Abyssobacteria bacterium SURF_17 TaxID=2093361 RepID=A0A419ENA5_9BACT|nr:MAG: hypothetical protein C4532_20005 [Candidatus Abyssubacteria bacterium SURF_17]
MIISAFISSEPPETRANSSTGARKVSTEYGKAAIKKKLPHNEKQNPFDDRYVSILAFGLKNARNMKHAN